jgi:hypothetical protein
MDTDLTEALGPTPSVNEKLYAAGLQDTRNSTAQWTQNNVTWAGDIANVQAYRKTLTADVTNRQAFRKSITDFTTKVAASGMLAPLVFDENDELYERCVMKGLEIRKQNLTTSSSQATIEDVINDGFNIGHEIFRRVQSRKAQVIAKTLSPTAVPTTL